MNAPVPQSEINRYWDFIGGEIQRMRRDLPDSGVLWHYTSGDGLVAIVESGELWTTQISCVNDSTELRHGVSLLVDALKTQRGTLAPAAPELIVYDAAIAGLEIDTAPENEWFIASLSGNADDLSQWRAYGGGEGGYAIGFDAAKLKSALQDEPRNLIGALVPVCYDIAIQRQVAQSIAVATGQFYISGLPLSGMTPTQ